MTMRIGQAIRTILRFEMSREWFGMAATVVFAVYIGVVLSIESNAVYAEEGPSRLFGGVLDFLFLFSFPVFGSLLNRSAFQCWRDDLYSKRIAHWRTMPIPLQAIAGARFLLAAGLMLLAGGSCLTVHFLLSGELQQRASGPEWLSAGIVWLAYGLIVQSVYTVLELGYSGKRYVKTCMGAMLLFAAVSALLNALGICMYRSVLDGAKALPILLPLLSLAAAAAAVFAGWRTAVRRMRTRTYSF